MDNFDIDANWNRKLANPIERQNDLSNLLVGEDILKNISLDFEKGNTDFIAEQRGQYFAYVTDTSINEINIDIEGVGRKSYENLGRKYLLDLGYLENETKVSFSNESKNKVPIKVVRFDYSVLNNIYDKLSANVANIKLYEAGHIEADINVKESGNLFLSIPYDKSWKIYVDSYPVTANKYLGAFISIPLTKGEHTISMRYEPLGFKLGLYISLTSIIILLLIIIYTRVRRYVIRRFA